MNDARPETPLFRQLEVGKTYRAWGPNGKNGPPNEVEITGVTEKGYVTKGTRQAATLIAFGCEHMWLAIS